MAPELMIRIPYDPNKMETWALGVCLFKLLTGKFPFQGKSDDELRRQLKEKKVKFPNHLSSKAVELIERMLTKDQLSRASTTEVIIDKWFMDVYYEKPKKKKRKKAKCGGIKIDTTSKDFLLQNSVSKFSLDHQIVKNIAKLGHSEETILNDVEDENSYIGRLYKKLFELKKQLQK
mmetsp:Transcript_39122/g.38749  ORF Transcript_39122/g.38749 Transcript_39122/m.38749 type:complete len:176 (+) Transcript_39122:120-647(+)|eukprot:CAMPEP_0197003478 /NCGR_PEP_ID=MMETSP1380-20130617/7728_1 /TAXON_ID=5936 /ORGANISM="Euplotes crassus, Strain CT5" /LENGTH=175 /DNA_ID=CAMNT_0042421995 /DNA_START=987 /DNA_END=1514 /DNA_ORIENTATION=+